MAELKEYLFAVSPEQKNKEGIEFGSIKGQSYYIPYLQRAYKWSPLQARQLLEDLKEFVEPNNIKQKYCMQPLAVCKNDKGWEVLDGQQRLTTLLLLYRVLFDGEIPYSLTYERQLQSSCESDISKYLMYSSISDDTIINKNQDLYNMSRVRQEIKTWLTVNKDYEAEFKKLLLPGGKSLLFLWYEVTQEERHKTFQNLNTGKIPLTNSDLVKALYLSNMSDVVKESMQDKSLLAAQFREMELALENNRFWHVICPYDSDAEHPRMDFIFNLVAKVSPKDYWATEDSSRLSFDYFYARKNNLKKLWNEIRDTYIRLKDLVADCRSYHYMGYLVYHSSSNARIRERQRQKYKDILYAVEEILALYKNKGFENCITEMQTLIKNKLNLNGALPSFDEKAQCRRIFVLHNIESILQRLDSLKKAGLKTREAESVFPFELLYSQNWDIEHIASQKENDLTSDGDRNDWLSGLKTDYPKIYEGLRKKIEEYVGAKSKKSKTDSFNTLHELAIEEIEQDMKHRGLSPIEEDKKDLIWNLVLLDDHTNRSYHNSLMPRKRRIILYASDEGLKSENIEIAYIPPCTAKVFQKSYNRDPQKLTVLEWVKPDAEAYEKDLKDKLKFYLA